MLSVMDEAAVWLHARGITEQWPASFSERPEWIDSFRSLIERNAVYIVWRQEEAVANVVLEEHPFSRRMAGLWPDGALDAVLLFRLAVRRSVAGQGVADLLLRWAAEYTRERGKSELRLDCWAGNERLKRYYLDAGFESCGDIEFSTTVAGEERTYSSSRFRLRV